MYIKIKTMKIVNIEGVNLIVSDYNYEYYLESKKYWIRIRCFQNGL